METPQPRAEAQRWIEVARKLLEARDLLGSKRFAKRARDTDPQVDGVDQINAVIDVLLASEKRINNHLDWYSILQLDRRSNDLEVIKRQYRKLALLLHPDKNKSSLSCSAFKFVCDAWAFLSDPNKKILYDNEFNMFMKFDPVVLKSAAAKARKSENRRSAREKKQTEKAAAAAAAAAAKEAEVVTPPPPPQQSRLSTFWTVCPYCYHLFEYPSVYRECCLRCQKCRRGFHAAEVAAPPPPVEPGKDFYYCCWAIFPIGYTKPENLVKDSNWSPFMSMFPNGNCDKEDEIVDDRGGKRGRTENLDTNVSTNEVESVQPEKKENVGGKIHIPPPTLVQDGVGANNVFPEKTVRMKTTARKSIIRPKPAETQNKKLDLSMEVKGDKEAAKEANVVEGAHSKSIDREAMEGRGDREEVTEANVVEGAQIQSVDRKAMEGKGDREEVTEANVVEGAQIQSIDREAMEGKGDREEVTEANFVEGAQIQNIDKEAIKGEGGREEVTEANVVEGAQIQSIDREAMEGKDGREEITEGNVVEGDQIRGIDKEATEGVGFFEGLDDILGNLPILKVQAEQKAEDGSSS